MLNWLSLPHYFAAQRSRRAPGRLLNRLVNTGSIGEWIASRIFDVELESAANVAGCDGHFTTGALAGRTVNVKASGRCQKLTEFHHSPDVQPLALDER